MNQNFAKEQSSQPPDNRYFPRWDINNKVLFQKEDDLETLEGNTKDISCTGAHICVSQPLPPNQKLKLVIFLSKENYVSVDGEVIWSKANQDMTTLGVQFHNTSTKIQDTILKYAFTINKNDLRSHFFKGWDNKN